MFHKWQNFQLLAFGFSANLKMEIKRKMSKIGNKPKIIQLPASSRPFFPENGKASGFSSAAFKKNQNRLNLWRRQLHSTPIHFENLPDGIILVVRVKYFGDPRSSESELPDLSIICSSLHNLTVPSYFFYCMLLFLLWYHSRIVF